MSLILVFDMDDTIFPEIDFVYSGFKKVDFFLKNELNIYNFFDKACEKFLLGNRSDIFNQFLKEVNYEGDINVLVKKLVHIYRSHKPDISLYNDAIWALKYYSKQVPLVLLTDGYFKTQQNKVESLNIDEYFEKYYYTDKWGKNYWKPNTFVFEKVQNDFISTDSNFVYISDNPEKDFIAPNKLNWNSIYIKREVGVYKGAKIPFNGEPKHIISSLFELKKILKI